MRTLEKLRALPLLLPIFAITALAPLAQATHPFSQDKLVVWTSVNPAGQTIDEAHSFVRASCDAKGTITVFGHIQKSNQAGQTLQVAVSDGPDANNPPTVVPSLSFIPNKEGNVNFSFTLSGYTPGRHALRIEVQNPKWPGVNLYTAATTNNGTGNLPVTCSGCY